MARHPAALAAGVLALQLATAAAGARETPQQRCIVALNRAAARLAAAAAANLAHCLRAAGRGKLAAGDTADRCVAADPGKRVARARARTTAVAGRACRTPADFGPTAASVNAAFGDALGAGALFGTDLQAAALAARTEKRGTACQGVVARSMAAIAGATLREFNACTAAGLRSGTIRSAADLASCRGADGHGALARAVGKARAAVARTCAGTSIGRAFPATCRGATAATLADCLAARLDCGACIALVAGDGAPRLCPQLDGLLVPHCGLPALEHSVARQWDEELLAAIRTDTPRPTVHARNLFHLSLAMYDAWAAYDPTAAPYLVREDRRTAPDADTERAVAISFAAHRILSARFATSPGRDRALASFDARLAALGFDKDFTSTAGPSAAAFGNRIAAAVLAFGLGDGSNEADQYKDPAYHPLNAPLIVKLSWLDQAPDLYAAFDPNRWQPLAFDRRVDQNGIPNPEKIQTFVGSHWGQVTAFALAHADPAQVGPPPQLGTATDAECRQNFVEVVRRSSQLDPESNPVLVDTSPRVLGNNPLGTNDGTGYPVNPATGEAYPPNPVALGDWSRVVAEFWADGPSSETPPGHWNVLANTVSDHPLVRKQIGGTGPTLSDLEWDVKLYLALNGAVHDAAIAAWGLKGVYDSSRPITVIRFLGCPNDPTRCDPTGLPLEPDLIEPITLATTAPGQRHAHLAGHEGEIAVRAWPGQPADPAADFSRVRWVRAVEWLPYQLNTFVTPAFAAYISGHSTFSRAAAEVLTRFTGSPYFPGGLGEFRAPQGTFLRNGVGPTQDVVLRWASYYDAADQAGISRLWGGIHIPADDFNGRRTGARVGVDAFDLAQRYFAGDRPETASRVGEQSARMSLGGEGERRAAAGEAGAADFQERQPVSGSAS